MVVSAGCPYKAGSQKKSVKETCFIATVTEHLSIEILTPPPPLALPPSPHPEPRWGNVGSFMVFEGTIRPLGVGDFSGFALHMHSSKWRSEVGIWLVPSFLTVISSGDILREILRLIVKENSFQFNGKQYLTNPWYCHGHKDSSFLCQSHWDCVFDTFVYRQGTRFNEKSILDVKTHFKQKETF